MAGQALLNALDNYLHDHHSNLAAVDAVSRYESERYIVFTLTAISKPF